MNISILASVGAQNLGDELILKNEVLLLEKKYNFKNINFRIFSYDYQNPFFEANNIEYIEYFPIGIKNPKNIFKNIFNFINFIKTIIWSDLVVIGGGGLIYDNEKQSVKNPLDQWIFRKKITKFLKKDIVFYGIGIDIKNNINYKKVKQIFSGAKEIFVRDINSQKILNKLGIKSEIIQDSVFYDNNHKTLPTNLKNLIKKIESNIFNLKDIKEIDFKNKNVGIAFRTGFFNNQLNKNIGNELELLKIKEIINFIINSGGKIILLPHSFHKNDKLANDYEFLKHFSSSDIYITSSMQETYKYYTQKKIDICLAQRLHSMILSEVYQIPFIGIIYGKKTRELLSIIG